MHQVHRTWAPRSYAPFLQLRLPGRPLARWPRQRLQSSLAPRVAHSSSLRSQRLPPYLQPWPVSPVLAQVSAQRPEREPALEMTFVLQMC